MPSLMKNASTSAPCVAIVVLVVGLIIGGLFVTCHRKRSSKTKTSQTTTSSELNHKNKPRVRAAKASPRAAVAPLPKAAGVPQTFSMDKHSPPPSEEKIDPPENANVNIAAVQLSSEPANKKPVNQIEAAKQKNTKTPMMSKSGRSMSNEQKAKDQKTKDAEKADASKKGGKPNKDGKTNMTQTKVTSEAVDWASEKSDNKGSSKIIAGDAVDKEAKATKEDAMYDKEAKVLAKTKCEESNVKAIKEEHDRVDKLRAKRPVPQKFELNDREKRIVEGKVFVGKEDAPTFEDCASDWDPTTQSAAARNHDDGPAGE